MDPLDEALVMYGSVSGAPGLEWSWVRRELAAAGAYWTTTGGTRRPHPRPVWGVWLHDSLYLSIGSPRLSAEAEAGIPVTVHLGSVTDVVIVDGVVAGPNDDHDVVAAYNAKYDWTYTIGEYGPLTEVAPLKVMAWRSAGWAGREGFQQTGRWRFGDAGHIPTPT